MASETECQSQSDRLGSNSRPEYSVFSRREKWFIASLVSYAAFFSTLSSFIYYPAIPTIAKSLSVSVEKINLTVTSYMAVATVGPILIGDAADVYGRRLVYITVLALYFISNIAIAAIQTYPALVGLRVLQALAISGTFSIAYGVVTDIASPSERGSYASVVSFAITIAPTLGPVLGGSLTYVAGWTWIFWFLSIASGTCLLLMFFALPETARSIAGNGSIKPPRTHRLLFTRLTFAHWPDDTSESEMRQISDVRKFYIPNPFKSLIVLVRRDNFIIITACGALYVVYTCMNASLSVLFVETYHLSNLQTGLIYIPFGAGGITSTFFSGPLLNYAYRQARLSDGLTANRGADDNLDDFPIEKARIRVIWVPIGLTTCTVLVFGWLLHYRKHIAILLCLQFIAGLCMQLDFSIYNTLLVDKNHRCPATAQAASNIVRCSLAAVTVAFLQRAFDALGIGWTFTLMSGLCLLATILFAIDYIWGFTWRQLAVSSPALPNP